MPFLISSNGKQQVKQSDMINCLRNFKYRGYELNQKPVNQTTKIGLWDN